MNYALLFAQECESHNRNDKVNGVEVPLCLKKNTVVPDQPLRIQVLSPELFGRVVRVHRNRRVAHRIFIGGITIAIVTAVSWPLYWVLLPLSAIAGVVYLVFSFRVDKLLDTHHSSWMSLDESGLQIYSLPIRSNQALKVSDQLAAQLLDVDAMMRTSKTLHDLELADIDSVHLNTRTYTISKSPRELTEALSQRGVQRNLLGITTHGGRITYEMVMRSRQEVESMLRIVRSWGVPIRGHSE